MERQPAGEGNSPSIRPGATAPPSAGPRCDERCAYGRLVARELAELRHDEAETGEPQSLGARVRRWWGRPQRGSGALLVRIES